MSFSKKIITVVFRPVFPKSGYPRMCLNRHYGSFSLIFPACRILSSHVTHPVIPASAGMTAGRIAPWICVRLCNISYHIEIKNLHYAPVIHGKAGICKKHGFQLSRKWQRNRNQYRRTVCRTSYEYL